MSEQENKRLIEKTYQYIKAGDIQSFLNLMADDVRWQLPEMENVPFAGKWRGREEVEEFMRQVFEHQDVIEFEPRDFVAQGDKVVVLGHFKMRIKSTDIYFTSDWAHIWTVNAGLVTDFYEYVDTAAVIRAYTAAQAGTQRLTA